MTPCVLRRGGISAAPGAGSLMRRTYHPLAPPASELTCRPLHHFTAILYAAMEGFSSRNVQKQTEVAIKTADIWGRCHLKTW